MSEISQLKLEVRLPGDAKTSQMVCDIANLICAHRPAVDRVETVVPLRPGTVAWPPLRLETYNFLHNLIVGAATPADLKRTAPRLLGCDRDDHEVSRLCAVLKQVQEQAALQQLLPPGAPGPAPGAPGPAPDGIELLNSVLADLGRLTIPGDSKLYHDAVAAVAALRQGYRKPTAPDGGLRATLVDGEGDLVAMVDVPNLHVPLIAYGDKHYVRTDADKFLRWVAVPTYTAHSGVVE